jgi:hypothetical protein
MCGERVNCVVGVFVDVDACGVKNPLNHNYMKKFAILASFFGGLIAHETSNDVGAVKYCTDRGELSFSQTAVFIFFPFQHRKLQL